MQIFKVISALMDYPQEGVAQHKDDLKKIIRADVSLSDECKNSMTEFLEAQCALDLLDWQSDYDALFERGRNLSLLLFEHVHGESRDRGQAMVDLIEQYKLAGLALDKNELPDYIPLFLEFLSTQDREDAKAWLMDVSHILAILATRLEERESGYASLFNALLEISQASVDMTEIRAVVAKEEPDYTNEAIDKVWEDEAVTFGGNATDGGACPSSSSNGKPTSKQSRVDEMPVNIVMPTPANHTQSEVKG
ncbi:MAG: nitrate reductase delta subunit [Oceanicoccus sp.]|jgi:nitrate reductase delta subunit